MRVIFCDIDGVMNSYAAAHYYWRKGPPEGETDIHKWFSPTSGTNLATLLHKIEDARIVISSTWRNHYSIEEFEEIFKPYVPGIEGKIIGKTGNLNSRTEEVAQYVTENDIEHYVIIDDIPVGPKDHLVQTSSYDGLTFWDCIQAAKILMDDPNYFLGSVMLF